MSHFTVMVIGDNPGEQLAPYDENLEVPEYFYGEVSEDDKKRMLNHYKSDNFDECYDQHGKEWSGNIYRKNEEGVWCEYSTYNPKSKWDWYQLGGRWSGLKINLKVGAKSGIVGKASWMTPDIKGYDAALKGDIDFNTTTKEQFAPYAIIKDGQWQAKGEMGWFGIETETYCSDEEWINKVWEMVMELPDDTLISFYDCHI